MKEGGRFQTKTSNSATCPFPSLSPLSSTRAIEYSTNLPPPRGQDRETHGNSSTPFPFDHSLFIEGAKIVLYRVVRIRAVVVI